MTLPHPVASVVLYQGRTYVVDEIGHHGDDYAILGHKAYGSEGYGSAWEDHDELELLEMPSEQSWIYLLEARGAAAEEGYEDEEDDD